MELALFQEIPFELLTGLEPRAWIAVGAGFSREDLKTLLLRRAPGFTARAITSLPEIALSILKAHLKPGEAARLRVLEGPARQEALRLLLSQRAISERLPELRRLKRQASFLRRLDRAIQNGRKACAHFEEDAVMAERAEQRLGPDPVRDEVRFLARVYENWLSATGDTGRLEAVDEPALLKRAMEYLEAKGWPARLPRPEKIVILSQEGEEALEAAFRETLAKWTEVRRVGAQAESPAFTLGAPDAWEKWHSLDDACERLADALEEAFAREGTWENQVVLMGDDAAVRRSVRRALQSRGIPLADARDPTRLEWEEALKWALLPLEVVAGGFERGTVVEWLRVHSRFRLDASSDPATLAKVTAEAAARGIRRGLSAWKGGVLEELGKELEALNERLSGRRALEEMASAHLEVLAESLSREGAAPVAQSAAWILPVIQSTWQAFAEDCVILEASHRKAPILFWLERLKQRLAQAPAPLEPARPKQGVALYRIQQAPLFTSAEGALHAWVIGLPPGYLMGDSIGDAWWGARDREVLSGEFAIRSVHTQREERLRTLRAWSAVAPTWTLLDYQYEPSGSERESLYPLLKAIWADAGSGAEIPEEGVEKGAHRRWARSYGASLREPPRRVELPPLRAPEGKKQVEITASTLDRYSRCPFQALIADRWRVRDGREPELELWPEVRGSILHEAVRELVATRLEEGTFTLSAEEALGRALKKVVPRGMMKNPRIEADQRARMVRALETFMQKEKEYFERAKAKVVELENELYRLDFDGVSVFGEPDRVDETPHGLFVIDYKTSSALPTGAEMLQSGYRLQLPFYGLAVSKARGQDLAGVQFIELSREGGRTRGVFLASANGKEPGKPTQVTKANKSLIDAPGLEVWAQLERHVQSAAKDYVSGRFEALPRTSKTEAECRGCSAADACGLRRRIADATGEGEGG